MTQPSPIQINLYSIGSQLGILGIPITLQIRKVLLLTWIICPSDHLGRSLHSRINSYIYYSCSAFIFCFIFCLTDIFPSRLETLLELSLRTTAANADPFKDDLRCVGHIIQHILYLHYTMNLDSVCVLFRIIQSSAGSYFWHRSVAHIDQCFGKQTFVMYDGHACNQLIDAPPTP
jgi:hypothetical protein